MPGERQFQVFGLRSVSVTNGDGKSYPTMDVLTDQWHWNEIGTLDVGGRAYHARLNSTRSVHGSPFVGIESISADQFEAKLVTTEGSVYECNWVTREKRSGLEIPRKDLASVRIVFAGKSFSFDLPPVRHHEPLVIPEKQ